MGPRKAGGWWMNQSIFEVANKKDVFGYLNGGHLLGFEFLRYRDSLDLFRDFFDLTSSARFVPPEYMVSCYCPNIGFCGNTYYFYGANALR